jgi:hypothetical protein
MEISDSKGEVKFARGIGIISHEVVGFYIKVRFQVGHFFCLRGTKRRTGGNEKIPGIQEDDVSSFLPQLLNVGRPPGQTAKLASPSATWFNLPINIGGKNQRNASFRFNGKGLSPNKKRGEKNQQNDGKIFFHNPL